MDRSSIQERFGIVGESDAIQHVIDRARQVAKTDITVLLQGESGVGKELIAQMLHELSMRRHEQMVIVNCGAIPEGLIESELFGAEKGAYTGAVEQRSGYFEEADGSTIFLDEIGEMPKPAQVRLLRVLETGQFARVGSSTRQQSDVRIVAATNKDLAHEVEQGRFRKDLYYRLSTVVVQIPPLRERPEDILPLFNHFLHRYAQEYNSPMKKLTQEAKKLLTDYRWPGNVRELRNVAEQTVVLLREEEVDADTLRPYLSSISETALSTELVHEQEERRGEEDTFSDRERELLYRAILEMQMDLSEVKEKLQQLTSSISVAVPTEIAERDDFSAEHGDFTIVNESSSDDSRSRRREPSSRDHESLIEDVAYEIEHEDTPERSEMAGSAAYDEPSSAPANLPEAPSDDTDEEEDELPTLEEAELNLIREALDRFDGNRRKTAQALGISERTLYRKIKELDEEL